MSNSSATVSNQYSIVTLVFSILGFLGIVFLDFGGIYITGYYSGYRYICLFCEYSTGLMDLIILLAALSLLGQILISLNDLLSEKFLPEDFSKRGFILALSTLILVVFGGLVFTVTYDYFEWWLEAGFYTGLGAGLIDSVLFYLKEKSP